MRNDYVIKCEFSKQLKDFHFMISMNNWNTSEEEAVRG